MDYRSSRPMIDTTGLFAGERDALLDLLRTLDSYDWWRATICGEWTVHDIALHLIGADVNVLSGDRDLFSGPPSSSTPGNLGDWAALVRFIDDRNEQWVEALRRVSPRLTCELLEMTGQLLAPFWSGLDLDAPGREVSWAGPGQAPVWVHVAREYTERWTHQQHIRDAVGRPGLTEPHWLGPVLEAFMLALPHTLRNEPVAEGVAVEVHVTGDAGGRWWALRREGAWALQRSAADQVVASVTLDQDTAWRLLTRGMFPAEAQRRARIEGDARLGKAVLGMVSIIA